MTIEDKAVVAANCFEIPALADCYGAWFEGHTKHRHLFCAACYCQWTRDDVGEPNRRTEWCEDGACPCHTEDEL